MQTVTAGLNRNHHAENHQRSAGELQQPTSRHSVCDGQFRRRRAAARFSLVSRGGIVRSRVFSFYIPGAGELAQGKSGLDEQRQVNVVNNLSVTRADDQLKFGEWRINPLSQIGGPRSIQLALKLRF